MFHLNFTVEEDDLDNIVDTLSDDEENDDDALQRARATMSAREEKARHEAILRRMREGYDGRRGNITSGEARGLHRFDQLVAADNREGAKRLGLLNDDEIGSDCSDEDDEDDGEEGNRKSGDEEEDEAILLDKMLKERFLRPNDENDAIFADDVSSDEDEENAGDGEYTFHTPALSFLIFCFRSVASLNSSTASFHHVT